MDKCVRYVYGNMRDVSLGKMNVLVFLYAMNVRLYDAIGSMALKMDVSKPS